MGILAHRTCFPRKCYYCKKRFLSFYIYTEDNSDLKDEDIIVCFDCHRDKMNTVVSPFF